MWEITIDDGRIQEEAETTFEEKLTEDELEIVKDDICGELGWVIQEAIERALDFRELLKRNEGAKDVFPHYRVFYRNEGAYIPNFEPSGAFVTKDDAEKYMHHEKGVYGGEWKIELADRDNAVDNNK